MTPAAPVYGSSSDWFGAADSLARPVDGRASAAMLVPRAPTLLGFSNVAGIDVR